MDGLRATSTGHIENFVNIQVRLTGSCRPNVIRVISFPDVLRPSIHIRENRNGFDAHLATGPNDTHSDLAPVGDQDSLEHIFPPTLVPRRSSGCAGPVGAGCSA